MTELKLSAQPQDEKAQTAAMSVALKQAVLITLRPGTRDDPARDWNPCKHGDMRRTSRTQRNTVV